MPTPYVEMVTASVNQGTPHEHAGFAVIVAAVGRMCRTVPNDFQCAAIMERAASSEKIDQGQAKARFALVHGHPAANVMRCALAIDHALTVEDDSPQIWPLAAEG